MTTRFELGLDTFGDVPSLPGGGRAGHAQTLRDVVEQAVLADRLGLDFIGLGEHHRADFAISAPEVVLAAIASRTRHIKLGSAVTILSTDDPIRVFQRFSTLHAISNGRAEVILGRGSFTESFPLFGHSLRDYERLFEEKIDLYAAVRAQSPVKWEGSHRAPLEVAAIYPPVEEGLLPTWVGVGGTPESVVRAAHYGFRLMLAIIGGDPARFAPFVELFERANEKLGKPAAPIGVHAPGFVADTDEEARERLWPHFLDQRTRIGGERGWPPPTRAQYEAECGPRGALFVGSPETVASKIVKTSKLLRLSRFDLKYANGAMTHEELMKTIALIGEKVAPIVRAEMAAGAASTA